MSALLLHKPDIKIWNYTFPAELKLGCSAVETGIEFYIKLCILTTSNLDLQTGDLRAHINSKDHKKAPVRILFQNCIFDLIGCFYPRFTGRLFCSWQL